MMDPPAGGNPDVPSGSQRTKPANQLGSNTQMLLDSLGVVVYFCAYEACPLGASIAGLVITGSLLVWKYCMYANGMAQKPPRRTIFPKQMDLLMFMLFVTLCAVTWNTRYAEIISYWNNFIWMASFFVAGVLSLMVDSPFIEQYVRDQVPEEIWNQPELRRVMWELTAIWTIGFLLMSISCAINPMRGIRNFTSAEAVMMNWALPAAFGVLTVIAQNCWTNRTRQSSTSERTPIVPPAAIPGSYESMSQDAGNISGVMVPIFSAEDLSDLGTVVDARPTATL
jgi:hypothetical protein